MKITVPVLFAILISGAPFAKAQVTDPAEAEKLFAKNRYTALWKYCLDKLEKDPANTDLNYKIGVCYLNSRSQKGKAISYFKRAIGSGDKTFNVSDPIYKLLGDACYAAADYDDAIANYELYKKNLLQEKNKNEFLIEDIESKMELCKVAKELKELKRSLAAFEMRRESTTEKNKSFLLNYPKVKPSLSSIELTRSSSPDKVFSDKDFYETDHVIGTPRFNPETSSTDTSTTLMETTVATSVDGQIILIYRNDTGEGNLYTSVLNGNEWMFIEKLDKNIGNKNWEPNEYISADGNTLFFASNREGGYGGQDIYKCVKLPNGTWGKAKNMGPEINSRFNEEAPFMYPDGNTLYFSSDRNRSNGYVDNFMSALSDSGRWSVPVNVGYPLHKSPSMFEMKEGQKNKSEKENYNVTFNNAKKTPITIIKRKISNEKGDPEPYTEVTISDNETGKITGIYHPDLKTGKFICMVPSEKNNNITYESDGYLFHSENINISKESSFYELEKSISFVPVAVGSQIVLNNIFFENGNSIITPASEMELERLLKFFNSNSKVTVEILMVLDKKSSAEEIKLAEERLQSLSDQLFNKGVSRKNIETKVYLKRKKAKKNKKVSDESNYGKPELKIVAVK